MEGKLEDWTHLTADLKRRAYLYHFEAPFFPERHVATIVTAIAVLGTAHTLHPTSPQQLQNFRAKYSLFSFNCFKMFHNRIPKSV
jgi:hypothetical protein